MKDKKKRAGKRIGKCRPYTDAEIRAIRKDYSMGHVIDNRRLKEAGANYRLAADGCPCAIRQRRDE